MLNIHDKAPFVPQIRFEKLNTLGQLTTSHPYMLI